MFLYSLLLLSRNFEAGFSRLPSFLATKIQIFLCYGHMSAASLRFLWAAGLIRGDEKHSLDSGSALLTGARPEWRVSTLTARRSRPSSGFVQQASDKRHETKMHLSFVNREPHQPETHPKERNNCFKTRQAPTFPIPSRDVPLKTKLLSKQGRSEEPVFRSYLWTGPPAENGNHGATAPKVRSKGPFTPSKPTNEQTRARFLGRHFLGGWAGGHREISKIAACHLPWPTLRSRCPRERSTWAHHKACSAATPVMLKHSYPCC